MNETTRKFISAFHSLNGTTIDERRKNFSLLLNRHSFLAKTGDLDILLRNLKPQSHLERIFWVELLLRFKRFDELLVEFKSGNEIVASKIARQHWFFERYFSELQPETFVNVHLPAMSYVSRLKILKKLSMSEEQTDQIFEAVCNKYGLLLATRILHKCSVTKIREVLQNNSVKLTPRQLKCIFDKQPDLIWVHIENTQKLLGCYYGTNDSAVFAYIARKDPDFFCAISEKYKLSFRLGKRTTEKFVRVKKDAILARPKESYVRGLQRKTLVRQLGSDSESFLISFFQKNNEYVSYCLTEAHDSFLKYCPKRRRFDLFKRIFNEIYTHEFGFETHLITEDILEYIYDNDEREHWAKIKYDEHNKEVFLQYFKAENCLNMLMPKLSHSTNNERKSYVKIMTRSCILSRDLDSMDKLAKLVEERFRNDKEANEAFVDSFKESDMDLFLKTMEEMSLRAIHWYEPNSYPLELNIFRLFQCLSKNDKSVADIVSRNPSITLSILQQWDDEIYSPQLRNRILSELVKINYEKPGNMDETAKFHMELAELCLDYKKVNRKHSLTVDIWQNGMLMESCKHIMNKSDISKQYSETLLKLFCSHILPKQAEELLAQFFATKFGMFKFADIKTYLWLLKHKPHVILDQVESFLDGIFRISEKSPRIWNTIKKYRHLGLDRKVVDFLSMKINDNGYELSKKEKSVMTLSMLMSPEEFIEFAQTYKPTSSKAPDLYDDFYIIQCGVAQNLKNLEIPEVILPLALDFCTGDYLRFALRPLYSAIYRTISEDKVIPYLDQLRDSDSVSVKKHSLFLSCVVLDTEKALNQLKTSTVLRTIPALKYFKKNPSQESWVVAKTLLRKTNLSCVHLLKSALKITVPPSYRQEYYKLLWDISSGLKQTSLILLLIPEMGFNGCDVMDLVANTMGTLFLKGQDKIDYFVANFMCKSDDSARFKWFHSALSDFKTTVWKLSGDKDPCRKWLFHFVQAMFKVFMEKNEKSAEKQREDAIEIAAAFTRVFQPSEAFDEYVLVSLMEFKNLPIADMSKSILKFSHQIVKMFGNTALWPFAEKMKLSSKWPVLELCQQMLELSESVEDDLLVVKLLPAIRKTEGSPEEEVFMDILTKLRNKHNSAVNLHLGLYLKWTESSESESQSDDSDNQSDSNAEFDSAEDSE